MDLLSLHSLRQNAVQEEAHDYHIEASCRLEAPICPECGSTDTVGFGRKRQLFMDSPVRGKHVGIWVERRRLRCKQCHKTFMEPLPDMDDHRQATKRLIHFIEKESVRRTFASIAEDTGLDEKTIRNIFRDYINRQEREIRFETPQWVGIDEIHLIKKPRCVISNIEQQTIIEVLLARNKTTLISKLNSLPDLDKIRYVAMAMWNPYRDAVRTAIPQAKIVVDKFHIVRLANQCLEDARKAIRAKLGPKQRRGLMNDRFVLFKRRHDITDEEYLKLSEWTINYPLLRAAFDVKEAFHGIWDLNDRADAERAYITWLGGLPNELRDIYKSIITAVGNWHDEIFAYFDHPITNTYTESLNNLTNVLNRLSRGYSFEAIRAKILFTDETQKTELFSLPIQQPLTSYGGSIIKSFYKHETDDDWGKRKETNYGAKISTLTDLIESGDF